MDGYQRGDMVDFLIKEGAVKEDQKESFSKALSKYWEGKISLVWSYEDVLGRAEQIDMDISKESAEEIIEDVGAGHDCNAGVSWETLDAYLENYTEESDTRLEIKEIDETNREDLPLLLGALKTKGGIAALGKTLKH